MNKKIVTTSSQDTQKLGEEIAKGIKNKAIFALHGELGAGKTTFVQGFARGLGIKKRIISPSFVIIRTYRVSNNLFFKRFYHIDLYRTENEKDLVGLGLGEIMGDPTNIVIVEWAEKAPLLASFINWNISFEYINENQRLISLQNI